MSSHLGLMAMFAFFVSTVFATIVRDEPREQARYAALLFAAFVAGGVIAGWLLYPLPL